MTVPRRATEADRERHAHGLAADEVRKVCGATSMQFPKDINNYYVQVWFKRIAAVLRGLDEDAREVLVDCGFGEEYWVSLDDERLTVDSIRYNPGESVVTS